MAETDAVVLNWKDPGSTIECIESLLADKGIRRVVVVDNESDGELRGRLAEVLSSSRVELIELSENRGFAAGINEGISCVRSRGAEFIVVVNNDAQWCVGNLEIALAEFKADPKLGAVAPFVYDPKGALLSSGGRLNPWTMSIEDRAFPGEPDFLTWAVVVVRGECIAAAGTLDERYFMYWEDVEWGERVRRLGWRLRVVSEMKSTHAISSSHSRAGSRIRLYSVAGLSRFVHSRRPGIVWVGGYVRLAARLSSRILAGQPRLALLMLDAWFRAARMSGPAYTMLPGLFAKDKDALH
jgi:GT2 family glycosyltransferase